MIGHRVPDYHNLPVERRVKGSPHIGYTCRDGELRSYSIHAQIKSYHLVKAMRQRAEDACKREYLGENYKQIQRRRQVTTPRPRDCDMKGNCWW